MNFDKKLLFSRPYKYCTRVQLLTAVGLQQLAVLYRRICIHIGSSWSQCGQHLARWAPGRAFPCCCRHSPASAEAAAPHQPKCIAGLVLHQSFRPLDSPFDQSFLYRARPLPVVQTSSPLHQSFPRDTFEDRPILTHYKKRRCSHRALAPNMSPIALIGSP